MFGFLGANGAGKTTTLKLLLQLIFETRPEVSPSPFSIASFGAVACLLGATVLHGAADRFWPGFVYYWCLRDYSSAAHWFERASAVPGAPEWWRPLAAVTLTRGGERGAARALWQQVLDTSDHDYLRRIAAYRLAQLRVLDDLDSLNALLLRVRGETGQPAASWAPLVRRGWIPRDPPTDPAGIPYVVDRDTGVATVSERSPYHPLPDVTTPGARPPS